MRLGLQTNGRSNELMMQSLFETHISKHNDFYEEHSNPQQDYSHLLIDYKREMHIPEVSRYADFLIKQKNKLINIELKTNPGEILLDQLISHSLYCDYCFALVPDFCNMPLWFNIQLIKHGFGLIVYNYKEEIFTEAIEAFKNKNRDLKLKNKYIKLI